MTEGLKTTSHLPVYIGHIPAFEGDSKVFYFEGSYSEYEENKKKRLGDVEPHRVRYRKLME